MRISCKVLSPAQAAQDSLVVAAPKGTIIFMDKWIKYPFQLLLPQLYTVPYRDVNVYLHKHCRQLKNRRGTIMALIVEGEKEAQIGLWCVRGSVEALPLTIRGQPLLA